MHPAPRLLLTGAAAAGIAVVSAGFGAGLTFASHEFGGAAAPYVLIAVPLVPLFALLVLNRPLIGAIAVFLSFPIASVTVPTGLTELRMVEFAVLVVTGLIALRRIGLGMTILPWASPLWWQGALIGWALVALPSSLDLDLAVNQVASLVGGVLFASCMLAACDSMKDLRKVLAGFTVVATGIAITSLASGANLRSQFGGSVVKGRAVGVFDQPNQLGSFAAVALLIALGLALGARTRITKLAAWVAVGLLATSLMLSLSRGAWVGTALALAYLVVSLPEVRRGLVVVGIPVLIVATTLGSFTSASNPQIQVVSQRVAALTELSPYDARDAIWAEARREIEADPWTGQGPGNFPVASVRAVSESSTVFAYHAHSIVLTWAAESGIPAALLIIGFVISLAIAGRRAAAAAMARGDRSDRLLISGIVAALIAMGGQGLIDYTFRNQVIFFTLWVAIAALLVAARGSEEPAVTTPQGTS